MAVDLFTRSLTHRRRYGSQPDLLQLEPSAREVVLTLGQLGATSPSLLAARVELAGVSPWAILRQLELDGLVSLVDDPSSVDGKTVVLKATLTAQLEDLQADELLQRPPHRPAELAVLRALGRESFSVPELLEETGLSRGEVVSALHRLGVLGLALVREDEGDFWAAISERGREHLA